MERYEIFICGSGRGECGWTTYRDENESAEDVARQHDLDHPDHAPHTAYDLSAPAFAGRIP
jgi:hypothetical protein